MDATVSEIHAYPLRPAGYAEPLFHSRKSRHEILEHLARSRWLFRASEATVPSSKHVRAALCGPKTSNVLASWREVDRWWEPQGSVDLVCYLVRTTEGAEEVLTRSPRSAWRA